MQLMVSPEQDAHKVKSIAPETIECCKQKHLVLGVQAWELILPSHNQWALTALHTLCHRDNSQSHIAQ